MLRLGDASARDERGVRTIPPLDDPDVHLGRAGGHAVERGLRHLAQAPAARCLAVRDETGGRAGGVENPERAGSGGCELDEQRECELRGDRPAEAVRTPCSRVRAGRPRRPRPWGGSPSSSAAAVTAARASPGSNRCSTATATIASPRKSSAAPCPQPSASRRARTSQARSAERRSGGRSGVAAERGLPAPIAAARAISSEARVAPTGETTPRSAAASTVSTVPFCVQ